MCGICGIFGREDKNLVEKMLEALKHRGPDAHGVYSDKNISMGHARLSIIDLSEKATQPFTNEEGTIQGMVNGEIYNFQKLRSFLENKGHKFLSNSDCETVVHLYEEYGLEFVKELRGMFALAIYDRQKNRLILARDHIGKKPLYYYHDGNTLIFASEIKAILESGVQREIDNDALWSYLKFPYTIGEKTLFKGIKKILPATMLVMENNNLVFQKYWEIHEQIIREDEDFFIRKLRALLEESVGLRVIADVPVGAFLSGGIDSSAIAALAKQKMRDEFHTFSVGFTTFSELEYAAVVSEHVGTVHHEMVITADMVKKDIEKITWHYDEPLGDAAIINNYYLAHEAKKYVKVVLAGEGGDELFAGYPYYKINLNFLRWIKNPVTLPVSKMLINKTEKIHSRIPSRKIRRILDYAKKINNLSIEDFHQNTGLVMTDRDIRDMSVLPESDTAKFTQYPKDVKTMLGKMLAMDCMNLLPEKYLMKADKATMANSLEERAPLLDKQIIEFAFSVPNHLKINNGVEKYLLRKAVKDLLPRMIINRPKVGFGTTIGQWMESDLKDMVQQKISDGRLVSRIMKPDYRSKLSSNLQKEIKIYPFKIWTLFALEIWYDTYFSGHGYGI
jgi:asparagine synthase (glutamine-hydrolysing)